MENRRINHIFFDYARTIVEHPADGAGLTIIRKTDLTDEKDILLVRNAAFSVDKYLNFLDEGSMARDEYKRLLLAEIPAHLHSFVLKAVDYHIAELPMIAGMKELLHKLKKDGYKILYYLQSGRVSYKPDVHNRNCAIY